MFAYAEYAEDRGAPHFACDVPVHLYRIDLDGFDLPRLAELLRTLAPEERRRAARFCRTAHRRRFMAARGMLRRILARYAHRDPASVAFAYLPRGKPYVPESGLHFSVSHSGRHALIAASRTHRLGIDVECIERRPDCTGIARRYFTGDERAELAAAVDPHDEARLFFRMWTRREATVKLSGLGIARLASAGVADPAVRWTTFAPTHETVATLAIARADDSFLGGDGRSL